MNQKNQQYKNKVSFLKKLQITLLICCLVAIPAYLFFIGQSQITTYAIKDECSSIGGVLTHPIDDEDSCTNICQAYCLSSKKEYHKSEFDYTLEMACNTCTCYCKSKKFI